MSDDEGVAEVSGSEESEREKSPEPAVEEDEEESESKGKEDEGSEEEESDDEAPPPLARAPAVAPAAPKEEVASPTGVPEQPLSPTSGGMRAAADVTAAEMEVINESVRKWFGYNEEVKLVEVVREVESKKGGLFGRKKKDSDLLLTLGKHHMWVHSRASIKKRAVELGELHLLDIKSMMHNAQSRRLTISLKSGPIKGVSLDYVLDPNSQMLKSFLLAFQQITYGFPENCIVIRSTDVLPEVELPETTAFDRVRSNYLAQCSLARVGASQELLYYLKNFFETRSIDLDFTCVPVIGNAGIAQPASYTADLSGSSVDDAEHRCVAITSVIPALCHEDVFRSLTVTKCCSVGSSRAVSHFLAQNHSITKLVLNRVCPSDAETASIISSISSSNAISGVELVDLSENPIGPKASQAMLLWLSQWTHPLKELCLANCGLNARTAPGLFQGLARNPRMSITVEHLDISGNKLELIGSQSMDLWLDTLKAYCKLHRLNLRDSGIVFGAISNIRHLLELEELDLSDNKIDQSWGDLLTSLVENSPRLNKLVLNNCGLSYDLGFHNILAALNTRQKDGIFDIDVSRNAEIGKNLARDAFANLGDRICALNLTGLKLREAHFLDIAAGIALLRRLERLNLTDACERVKSTSSSAPAITQALIVLAKSVKVLGLGECFGKGVLVPFLEQLPADCAVTTLDLSNNALGDVGMGALVRALVRVPTVTSVNMDGNHTRLNGFLALATLFMDNETLAEINFTDDFQRELVSLSSPEDRKRLMDAVMIIHCSLAAPENRPVWFTNAHLRIKSPTPAQFSSLPEPPLLFKDFKPGENTVGFTQIEPVPPSPTTGAPPALAPPQAAPSQPAEAAPAPAAAPQAPTSTADRFSATRQQTHKPIIASRVVGRSPASTSPSKAPPTLAVPPSFSPTKPSGTKAPASPPKLEEPPFAKAETEHVTPRTEAASRRPGHTVARRAVPARRAPVGPPSGAHSKTAGAPPPLVPPSELDTKPKTAAPPIPSDDDDDDDAPPPLMRAEGGAAPAVPDDDAEGSAKNPPIPDDGDDEGSGESKEAPAIPDDDDDDDEKPPPLMPRNESPAKPSRKKRFDIDL